MSPLFLIFEVTFCYAWNFSTCASRISPRTGIDVAKRLIPTQPPVQPGPPPGCGA